MIKQRYAINHNKHKNNRTKEMTESKMGQCKIPVG